MTTLIWDKPGEKIYQTGVDRGVLYLHDGRTVVWNGLTSVEDDPSKETNAFYLNGLKYLEYISSGDFSAKLSAFTYPKEFDEVNGVLEFAPGFRVHDQPSKSFDLSYRTMIGDDLIGTEAGYLIHLLYNVLANPDSHAYPTLAASGEDLNEFSWTLSAKPADGFFNWRPTAHLSLDSREISEEDLQAFEDIIYGTSGSDPSLPSIDAIFEFLGLTIPEPPVPPRVPDISIEPPAPPVTSALTAEFISDST